MKNPFPPAFGLQDVRINAMCIQVKIYASLVPPKSCQKHVQNSLGTKTILSGGGRGKMFNRDLMNKLMRIE